MGHTTPPNIASHHKKAGHRKREISIWAKERTHQAAQLRREIGQPSKGKPRSAIALRAQTSTRCSRARSWTSDEAPYKMPRMGSMENNKPWAVLRVSRKDYAAARPWKKAGMSRKEFESLILELPDEFFSRLREEADAERLAEAIFKGAAD